MELIEQQQNPNIITLSFPITAISLCLMEAVCIEAK